MDKEERTMAHQITEWATRKGCSLAELIAWQSNAEVRIRSQLIRMVLEDKLMEVQQDGETWYYVVRKEDN